MTDSQLRKEILKAQIKTLNPKSKWYNEDAKHFKSCLLLKRRKELIRIYSNILYMDSPSIEKSIDKMHNSGMFHKPLQK